MLPSPAANAVDQACKASLSQTANETDELNTAYLYEADEPHRLLTVNHPAGAAGDTKRLQETYAYDSGGAFDGLWVEKFENDSLAGVPDDEALWDSLNRDWGTGAVPGLSATNNFSLRLSGKLKIDGPAPKKYQFRVTGDDGYTLVVGSSVLLNCFYITTPAVNCGQATPEKKLWAGNRPITIEYREETGSANLKVEWKPEGGVWAVIPADHLIPDLGLMTRSTSGPKSQASDNLRLETKYLFNGDAAKMTRLAVSKVTTDLGTAFTKTTDFEYDDYGRRTKTTKFATQGSRGQGRHPALLHRRLPHEGDRPRGRDDRVLCNAAGDVTQTKLTVAAVTIGAMTWPQQTRIEDTSYDKVGRPTRVEHAGPGVTTYSYDSSGRLKTTKELLAGPGDGGQADEWATTTLTYADWPTSGGPTMTEMLDDPDDAGPLGRPSTMHEFDWVGNEVKKTDPNSQVWTTELDAQNRITKTTTPDPDTSSSSIVPLVTTTSYGLTNVAESVTTTRPGWGHLDHPDGRARAKDQGEHGVDRAHLVRLRLRGQRHAGRAVQPRSRGRVRLQPLLVDRERLQRLPQSHRPPHARGRLGVGHDRDHGV